MHVDIIVGMVFHRTYSFFMYSVYSRPKTKNMLRLHRFTIVEDIVSKEIKNPKVWVSLINRKKNMNEYDYFTYSSFLRKSFSSRMYELKRIISDMSTHQLLKNLSFIALNQWGKSSLEVKKKKSG